MKHILVTIALLLTLSQAQGQVLGDISAYRSSAKVYEGAKLYYNDEVKTGVNDTTKRIIDSLETKNNFTRPFYLLEVSMMLRYTDADLAIVLFRECYSFLSRHPNELVEFLYCDNNYVLGDYKNYWATAVSFQLRKSATGNPKEFLGTLQEKMAKTCKKKNQANFNAFFELIADRL